MSFSKVLRELMKESGTTQMCLAKHIGFSQRAVSKWVNAQSEPTEGAIVACANYFNVSADEMLGFTDYTPNARIEEKQANIDCSSVRDPGLKQLLSAYNSMSEYNKARILAYADFIREEHRRN